MVNSRFVEIYRKSKYKKRKKKKKTLTKNEVNKTRDRNEGIDVELQD